MARRQQTHGALPPPPQAPGQQATHPLHKQPNVDYPHHLDNGKIVPVGKLVNGCWVVRTSPSVYAPLIAHHANKLAQRQAAAEAKPASGFAAEAEVKPAITPVPGNAEGVA